MRAHQSPARQRFSVLPELLGFVKEFAPLHPLLLPREPISVLICPALTASGHFQGHRSNPVIPLPQCQHVLSMTVSIKVKS